VRATRCRLISCGELEDAKRRSTAALNMTSDDGTAIAYFGQLVGIRCLQGRAEELLDAAPLEIDRSGDPAALTIHLAMVLLHVQAGRRREAQQAFDAILDDDLNALAIGGVWTRYRQLELALLADICARLDHIAGAARLHPLLVPYDGLHAHAAVVVYLGPFGLYLGMLESVLEHYDDAIAHLESARNYLEQTGARALELRARAELGFAVASVSNSGKERGYQLLQAAREKAEQLGLLDIVRRCNDLDLRLRP
jgi:tetratricopeptide (TPR) repeat protein